MTLAIGGCGRRLTVRGSLVKVLEMTRGPGSPPLDSRVSCFHLCDLVCRTQGFITAPAVLLFSKQGDPTTSHQTPATPRDNGIKYKPFSFSLKLQLTIEMFLEGIILS